MERDRTLMALRLAECTLSDVQLSPESETRGRALFDMAVGGVLFMRAGWGILYNSMVWTIIVTIALYAFFEVCHLFGQLPTPSWGVLVGGGAIVYFALPSRHSFAGVTANRVKKVSDGLRSTVLNRDDLKRLQAGIEMARGNSMERINRTTFVLNLAWGVWFWFFTTQIFAPSIPKSQLALNVNGAAVAFIFFTMVLLMAATYVAAVRAMHQVLGFALLDLDAQLAAGENKEPECR